LGAEGGNSCQKNLILLILKYEEIILAFYERWFAVADF